MPSLSAGTNWTFNGRAVDYPGSEPNCITASKPVKFVVVVSSAGALSTNYSSWNGSGLTTNLKQQSVVLAVSITVEGGKTETFNFYGLFEEGNGAVGEGRFYSVAKDFIDLSVISSDSVCSGKQAARIIYTGPGETYTSVMGFVCRNNNLN